MTFPNAPSWRISNKNNQSLPLSQPNQMRQNVPTKEKPKRNPRKTTINKSNHPPMNKKFQGVDVHSWVDQKKRGILTFSKTILATMNPLSQNSITIFRPTKLIFPWWDKRKANNRSQGPEKSLTLTQFTSNIPSSLTEKITKKSEESSAAQDSCPTRNSEKRETSTSTKENMPRLLITMKELFPCSSGSNNSKKTTPKNPSQEFLPNNPSSPVRISQLTRDPKSTSTLRTLRKKPVKTFSKKTNNLNKWEPSTKNFSSFTLMVMSSFVTAKIWKMPQTLIWESPWCFKSYSTCQLLTAIFIITLWLFSVSKIASSWVTRFLKFT